MDLHEALFGDDSRALNEALKSLYMNPVINAKVQEWSRKCNLKGKEPDDILQEGIVILVDQIQARKFRGDSSVKTYLLGICKRLIWGSVKKKEILDFQEHFQEGDGVVNIPEYHHFDEIEQSKTEKQRDQTLNDIIAQMDEKCQLALKLFYYKKTKMAEIALHRGLKNAEQAKKAVSRCRNKLRIVIQSNPLLLQLLNR